MEPVLLLDPVTVRNSDGAVVNPSSEESSLLLRVLFRLLKPLGIVTNGTGRLSVDVNSTIGSVTIGTLPTLANVTTVATVTNQAQIGAIPGFDLMKAMSRNCYANSIRSKITIS